MLSADHTAEGKRYLEKGLQLVKNGDIDNAIEAFSHAAVQFEKAQNFRQISALWEAIGKLSELEEDSIPDITKTWPLDYHIVKIEDWNRVDPMRKVAWVYAWAAQHRERAGSLNTAISLYLKSVEKAKQSEYSKKHPEWLAGIYYKVLLNCIRALGTAGYPKESTVIDDVKVRKVIEEMENFYLKVKNRTKAYKLLADAYGSLRSNFHSTGKLTEAEQFKRKERSALMHYYFHSRSYFRAMAEWLSGIGFMYFLVGCFVTILFIFPFIYYQWDLITSAQGEITYPDAILYSIEAALNIGHSEFYAVGSGKLLNIIEAALSWLGLGVFIWWVTRRLE